jgi:hypothetical protein
VAKKTTKKTAAKKTAKKWMVTLPLSA